MEAAESNSLRLRSRFLVTAAGAGLILVVSAGPAVRSAAATRRGGATRTVAPNSPAPSPAATLARRLGELRYVHALRLHFICAKKLPILKRPFISEGLVIIARPDRVRFQTERPYRSCYILTGATVFSRNQTDRHWRRTRWTRQPTLAAILRRFATWSLGQPRHIGTHYAVTVSHVMPPVAPRFPAAGADQTAGAVRATASASRPASAAPSGAARPHRLTLFTLRPRQAALAQAVRAVQLGFPRHSPYLTFLRIISRRDDQSIYWFDHFVVNPPVASGYFAPVGPP